jgi:hypothetical protein
MNDIAWVDFIARLDNNTLWELLDRRSLAVEDRGDGRYVPIPSFTVISQHQILAVGCRNPYASPGWNLGCYCSASIAPGISVQAQIAQLLELGNYRIPLNQFKLIALPEFQIRPYGLRFSVPKWHRQLNLEIWWFNDPFNTDVQNSLNRIESELNSLT